MNLPTVLLTDPIAPQIIARMEHSAKVVVSPDNRPETLTAHAAEADIVVVRSLLPPELFEQAPRLRGVVRHGAGIDMIPVDIASQYGVAVANVPGANARTVAEYAMGQMFNLAHRLVWMDRDLRAHGWKAARAAINDTKFEVSGRRLGIVGLGQIGQTLAYMAHHGFNMKVAAYRPSMQPALDFVQMQGLQTLFSESDFIVLACPLNEQTRGMVSAGLLQRMQRHAMLINVARGAVIDEDALLIALRERRIGGAALDVFTHQPLRPDAPMLELDNVVLSTHMAGLTQESMLRMGEKVADQVLQLLRGELPEHLCNAEHKDRLLARLQGFRTQT